MTGTGPEAAALDGQGWALVPSLFDADECAAIAAADARRTWPAVNRDLMERVRDPRWAPLAVAALGPDVRAFREQVLTKAPRSTATVPWHQDHAYAPLSPPALLTCLVALGPTDEDGGCLWVAPGSHLGGPVPHEPSGAIVAARDAPAGTDGVPVPLRTGDVLAFRSLTLHRSGPNRTDRSRPLWLVQFCAADLVDERTGQPPPNCPLVAHDGAWLAP